MTSPSSRRAHIVGLGLIGASLALALRGAGWDVTGTDIDDDIVSHALLVDLISGREMSDDHELVVVATPAGTVADVANEVLSTWRRDDLIVSDVAGVKGSIVEGVDFVISDVDRFGPGEGVAESGRGVKRGERIECP